MHTHTYTITCTHTYTITCTHTYTITCTHTYTIICTHTLTQSHAHTHLHNHMHTHMSMLTASCSGPGPGFHDKVTSNTTLARRESFLPVTPLDLNTQGGSSTSDLDIGGGDGLGKGELDVTIVPRGHSSWGAGEGAQPRGSPPKGYRRRGSPQGGTDIPTLRVSPSDSQGNSTNSAHSYTASSKMPSMFPFPSDEMGPPQGPSPLGPATLLRTDSNTETASCSNDADGESDGGRGGGRREDGQTWSAESTSVGISSSSPDPDHDHVPFSREPTPPETLSVNGSKPLVGGLGTGQAAVPYTCKDLVNEGQLVPHFETEEHKDLVPRPTIFALAGSYSPAQEEASFYASSPGHQHTPLGPTSIVRQYFENVAIKGTLETSHHSSSTELEDSGFQVSWWVWRE